MTGMEHAIEQAAMDARRRAYRDRKTPIQEEDGWAFGQGVTAGVHAALAVLRDRGLLAPAPLREEWGVRWHDDHSDDDVWGHYLNHAEARDGAADGDVVVHRYVSDWLPVDRAEGDRRDDQ